MQYKVFLFIFILLLSGCSSIVESDLSRVGKNYYPVEVGQFRIYDVKETLYFVLGPEESEYQLRERITDSSKVENSVDQVRYTLERSTRANENERWEVDSIWTAIVDPFRVVSNENNEWFIKLVFPIENDLQWDGNAQNARSFEAYRYEFLSDTLLSEQEYNDLWIVYQSEQEQDFLGRDLRSEIYAPDIGLISRNISIWSFCQLDECPEDDQTVIVAGRDLEQTLIENGKE